MFEKQQLQDAHAMFILVTLIPSTIMILKIKKFKRFVFHSSQSSIVSLSLSYSSTIVEWTADQYGLKMLNSKILCEEVSPGNSNRRLTPGELVMANTSYQAQSHGSRNYEGKQVSSSGLQY